MAVNPKLQIYKGIIQYLLDTTGYNLDNIAALANTTIKSIYTIYQENKLPPNFSSSEKHLVRLYQMILELNTKTENNLKHLTKSSK